MFGKLFKKRKEKVQGTDISLVAYVSGEMVALEDVPDPVFSQKMMGQGVAIKPVNGEVLAPVSGEIIQVFPTKHAIGILADNGAEVLIHVGLETVNMNGKGFTAHVAEGDKVNKGEKLISFDLDLVKKEAKSTIIPMVITNSDDMRKITVKKKSEVASGQEEILIVRK